MHSLHGQSPVMLKFHIITMRPAGGQSKVPCLRPCCDLVTSRSSACSASHTLLLSAEIGIGMQIDDLGMIVSHMENSTCTLSSLHVRILVDDNLQMHNKQGKTIQVSPIQYEKGTIITPLSPISPHYGWPEAAYVTENMNPSRLLSRCKHSQLPGGP